jgi:hypothetical protein
MYEAMDLPLPYRMMLFLADELQCGFALLTGYTIKISLMDYTYIMFHLQPMAATLHMEFS